KKCSEADRHKIYGYKIANKLAGKLHIIPLEVFIEEETFTMGGISSVATWPEHSGNKIAEKLIKQSLQDLQKNNTTLAYLHPFNAGFYRRFGFELAFNSVNYIIPIEKLRHDWKKLGFIERDSINLDELNQVYEIFIQQFNGGLKRDEKWWQERVLTDNQAETILIKDDNGTPQAYLIYKYKENCLEVIEMAYSNQAYKESIYHFIMKHQSSIKEVKISTYESDLLDYIVSDSTFSKNITTYFMARIVSLQSFLEKYPFKIVGNEYINLFVQDDFLPDNTGFYQVLDNKVIRKEVTDQNYLVINISDLAALLMGYKTIKELQTLDRIQGNEQEINKLKLSFNPKNTYLLDYF